MNYELRIKNIEEEGKKGEKFPPLFHTSYFILHTSSAKQGQAVILAAILFMAISITMGLGAVHPALNGVEAVRSLERGAQSLYGAEGVTQDVLYRLTNSLSVSPVETLFFGGATSTATTTTVSDGKEVEAAGNTSEYVRKNKTHITSGDIISFHYGVQAGEGGFDLSDHVVVNGNVYSNGPIETSNQVSITGTAIAANSGTTLHDQTNGTTTPPVQSVKFRDTEATQDFAQSFVTSSTSPIVSVRLYIKKTGDPSGPDVRIYSNNAGVPGTKLADEHVNSDRISTSYSGLEVVFDSNPMLTTGVTYWLVIDNDGDNSSKYYTIAANSNGYGNGQAKVGKLSNSSWNNTNPSGLDGYFDIFLGSAFSIIDGASGPSDLSIGGDAWAHTVIGSTVMGSLYCESGSDNNKTCDASRKDPPAEPLPILDAQIYEWKATAAAGGTISGNYTLDNTSATVGPKKITGNLTVEGNSGSLTLSGPIWVQGNVTIENEGQVRLASSYVGNSGFILADGWIDLSNHADIAGSGQSGSYLMMLSTSTCTSATCSGHNAIEISNQADAVILYAPNGTVELQDKAELKEVTGKTIKASNKATITYETGLANVNFTTGPSTGYTFDKWREVE